MIVVFIILLIAGSIGGYFWYQYTMNKTEADKKQWYCTDSDGYASGRGITHQTLLDKSYTDDATGAVKACNDKIKTQSVKNKK